MIPSEVPLDSQMLPLFYFCLPIIPFISWCPCFVSWINKIPGFSCFIRSFKATILEGCPSPLLFQERAFIIENEGYEEFLALPSPYVLYLYHIAPRYRTLWDSECPWQYPSGHVHLSVACHTSFMAHSSYVRPKLHHALSSCSW